VAKFLNLPRIARRGRQRPADAQIRIIWRSTRHPHVYTETYNDEERARNALISLERCDTSVVIAVERSGRDDHQSEIPVSTGMSFDSNAA